MASPHVAGAAALLASGPNKPAGRTDVLAIRQELIDTGNLDWTDESGDGFKEPLLDVSTFSPTLIPSAGDGAYTDSIGRKGGGSYTYQVCGGGACSAEVTVTF
jgi:hypothetical protein